MDPYLLALAFTGAVAAYVVLLAAHRKIPRTPPPDSINEMRHDFLALADQFADFVEKHDEQMGRHHAKVGSLRRKLRRLQDEEGDFDEADDGELDVAAPTAATTPPTRQQVKQQALRVVAQQQGRAG